MLLTNYQLKQKTIKYLKLFKHDSGIPIVKDIYITDILEQHSKDNNAIFQVASQFNCLEFMSFRSKPEHGISIYSYDNTQGPSCAIASFPSTLYRNYLIKYNNQNGQTNNNQINNLDIIQKYLHNNLHIKYILRIFVVLSK